MLSLTPSKPYILQLHPLYDHFGEKLPREEACKALDIASDKHNLLYFGLIRDYKGLDILIDAFASLDDSFQLVIAGECYGSFEKYEQQIASSPVRDRIKVFARYIGDEEVPAFFSAADVCVLPYRSATQSGITAISLHFDLPLIATPVGGLPQSIGKAGVGLMASASTPEAVADAVQAYFAAPQDGYRSAISAFKAANTWANLSTAITDFAATL